MKSISKDVGHCWYDGKRVKGKEVVKPKFIDKFVCDNIKFNPPLVDSFVKNVIRFLWYIMLPALIIATLLSIVFKGGFLEMFEVFLVLIIAIKIILFVVKKGREN